MRAHSPPLPASPRRQLFRSSLCESDFQSCSYIGSGCCSLPGPRVGGGPSYFPLLPWETLSSTRAAFSSQAAEVQQRKDLIVLPIAKMDTEGSLSDDKSHFYSPRNVTLERIMTGPAAYTGRGFNSSIRQQRACSARKHLIRACPHPILQIYRQN